MWLKYASGPLLLDHFYSIDQEPKPFPYTKPRGWWITDDSEDNWRQWCVAESFMLDALTHKHEVILDESRILILRTGEAIDGFTESFSEPVSLGRLRRLAINWHAVAEEHSGIIITPYQWTRRLTTETTWYYGWDCASGCIWDAAAIRDIRLIEIDHEVTKAGEAA